jgi:pSer/pThr/pTyr-binding forkhead associated (FHA) protein
MRIMLQALSNSRDRTRCHADGSLAVLRLARCPDGEDVAPNTEVSHRHCLTFGRDPRSDLVLKWDGISRAHAWLDLVPTASGTHGHCGWELICNGSGNGSFVNGVRRSRVLLHAGDTIAFGHGHDVCEGELLEDEALIYKFVVEHMPEKGLMSDARNQHFRDASVDHNSIAAGAEGATLGSHNQLLRALQKPPISPIHRRVVAARSAAADNLEVVGARVWGGGL